MELEGEKKKIVDTLVSVLGQKTFSGSIKDIKVKLWNGEGIRVFIEVYSWDGKSADKVMEVMRVLGYRLEKMYCEDYYFVFWYYKRKVWEW